MLYLVRAYCERIISVKMSLISMVCEEARAKPQRLKTLETYLDDPGDPARSSSSLQYRRKTNTYTNAYTNGKTNAYTSDKGCPELPFYFHNPLAYIFVARYIYMYFTLGRIYSTGDSSKYALQTLKSLRFLFKILIRSRQLLEEMEDAMQVALFTSHQEAFSNTLYCLLVAAKELMAKQDITTAQVLLFETSPLFHHYSFENLEVDVYIFASMAPSNRKTANVPPRNRKGRKIRGKSYKFASIGGSVCSYRLQMFYFSYF